MCGAATAEISPKELRLPTHTALMWIAVACLLSLGVAGPVFLIFASPSNHVAFETSQQGNTGNFTQPTGMRETEAFAPFQCDAPFETCAQKIAEDYCGQRQGSLHGWQAEPAPDAGPKSHKLVEIVCRQGSTSSQ